MFGVLRDASMMDPQWLEPFGEICRNSWPCLAPPKRPTPEGFPRKHWTVHGLSLLLEARQDDNQPAAGISSFEIYEPPFDVSQTELQWNWIRRLEASKNP